MRTRPLPLKIIVTIILVAFAAAPFGCIGGNGTTTSPNGTAVQGPSVTITAPQFDFDPAHPGERPLINGPTNITVQVEVKGFTLAPPGQGSSANSGHLVYYMDVIPPTAAGQSALTAPGTFVTSTATSHTWQNVTPGPHIFYVMLVNTNNTPLQTPIFDEREIFVISPPVSTAQPSAGASVHIITPTFDFDPEHPGERPLITGPNITIGVEVIGFNLVAPGQSGQAPFGHLVYYLDAIPPTTAGQSALTQPNTFITTTSKTHTWQNVTPGPHVFWVQLVTTTGTPLSPAVLANITLIVSNP